MLSFDAHGRLIISSFLGLSRFVTAKLGLFPGKTKYFLIISIAGDFPILKEIPYTRH